ncbi:hypothetical protein CF326_g8775 [Tilletia indica]|nr:hypothetical protein CF326_g8775 [Tilletia indica]
MSQITKRSKWERLAEATRSLVEASRDFQALAADLKIDATIAGTLDRNDVDAEVRALGRGFERPLDPLPPLLPLHPLPPLQAANTDMDAWRSLERVERSLVEAAKAFSRVNEELKIGISISGTLYQHGIDIRAKAGQGCYQGGGPTGDGRDTRASGDPVGGSSKRRKKTDE